MAYRLTEPRRAKVSVTVDPALLKAVDRFVQEHPDSDRSSVFDAALLLWYGEQQEKEIAEQHQAPQSAAEQDEHRFWRRIQSAAIDYSSDKSS
jgi:metal-responsive CopG/Arc/MetJ family transcriptional regulator